MKNIVVKSIKEIFVVAHADAPPTNEEWVATLDQYRKLADIAKARILVFTEGGAPNTLQRDQLNKLFQGRHPKTAVVTGSRMVRGVVTAVSWFNPQTRAFAPNDLEGALAHLNVEPSERSQVLALAAEVQAEIRRRAVG
jgi:hypothetical protein